MDATLNHTTLDRMQFIDASSAVLPQACIGCKGFSGRFLDTGLDIDYYGVVYFCDVCLISIIMRLGYIPVDQREALQFECQDLQKQLNALIEENRKLRDAINLLTDLRDSNNSDSGGDTDVPIHKKPEPKSSPSKGNSSRKAGSSKQADEQGSTDVLNDDDITKLFD